MISPSNEGERMLGRILALLFCTSIRIALCIFVYVELISGDDLCAPLKLSTQYISSYRCKKVHSTAGCCTGLQRHVPNQKRVEAN